VFLRWQIIGIATGIVAILAVVLGAVVEKPGGRYLPDTLQLEFFYSVLLVLIFFVVGLIATLRFYIRLALEIGRVQRAAAIGPGQ
jgi:hypothetical protein